MEYIHVQNLEKHHPGYIDRNLQWAKIHLNMVAGDPECEMIKDEIDWARLIKMILLELRAKKPLPNSDDYWAKHGFNIKKRPMSLTFQMLHNFIEIVTLDEKLCSTDKTRVREEKEKSKTRIDLYVDWEQSTLSFWNSFVSKYPSLSRIEKISDGRRLKLKKRFESSHYRGNISKAIELVPKSPFLMGENKSGWRVSFDWLISNDTNYLKVLEGKYMEREDYEKLRKQFGL